MPTKAYIAVLLVSAVGLVLYLLGQPATPEDQARSLLQDAAESLLRGDDERALALYRRARQAPPYALNAHLGEAGILTGRRRFAQAAAILRSAIPLAGVAPRAWCALGRGFRDARSSDEAIRSLSRALELDSDQDVVWIELGDLYRHIGDTGQAERCYRRAGRTQRGTPARLAGLGRLHADLGRADSAVVCFQRALRSRPHDPDLLCDYAEALIARGGHGDAIEVLHRALGQDAHHLRSRYLLVGAHRAVGHAEASSRHMEVFSRHRALMDRIDRLEASTAESPTAEGFQMLSHLYTRIGRDSLAARRLMRATCLDPMVTVPQEMEGASTY